LYQGNELEMVMALVLLELELVVLMGLLLAKE
jgi:hypothetical protein